MFAESGLTITAATLNLIASVLLIFAAATPFWSWGGFPYLTATGIKQVTVAAGPWVAGFTYNSIPAGACATCLSQISKDSVLWRDIDASQACPTTTSGLNDTQVLLWSQPLNLCGGTASSPTFNIPSVITGTQATIIIAAILCTFAWCLGCADFCNDEYDGQGHRGALKTSTIVISFCAMVFSITAFSLWASFSWVKHVQFDDEGEYMPLFVEGPDPQALTSIPTKMWWGPGWISALTAFIIQFFATLGMCLAAAGALGETEPRAARRARPAPAVHAPGPVYAEQKPTTSTTTTTTQPAAARSATTSTTQPAVPKAMGIEV